MCGLFAEKLRSIVYSPGLNGPGGNEPCWPMLSAVISPVKPFGPLIVAVAEEQSIATIETVIGTLVSSSVTVKLIFAPALAFTTVSGGSLSAFAAPVALIVRLIDCESPE